MTATFRALRNRCFLLVLAAFLICTALWPKGVNKRLRFPAGQSSTSIDSAVIRGEMDRYILGAKAGQSMKVTITSLEYNAAFQISKPDGGEVPGATSDASKWSGTLPVSGDYVITVHGTRGNATYKLAIAIQ